MVKRFKLWLKRGKNCNGFCVWCKHFEVCKRDVDCVLRTDKRL